jgi:energy-converting hydrogenase Eha subunit G
MTSQVTNRKEEGSMSFRGCSRKLRAYTKKELEIVRAAPELLGALTIGKGCAWPGCAGGEIHRGQISLPSRPKYTKTSKKRAVSCIFGL